MRGRQEVNVLEVGCGLGATLARIQFMYPYAHVYGMELMPEVASVGGRILDIVQGDIENSAFPFDGIQFDYIIFADVLEHLHEPERIVREMAERLKKGGAFICSIPNIMNLSVLYPLLQGKFEYEEAGILDRTHLKFLPWTVSADCLRNVVSIWKNCFIPRMRIKWGNRRWNACSIY